MQGARQNHEQDDHPRKSDIASRKSSSKSLGTNKRGNSNREEEEEEDRDVGREQQQQRLPFSCASPLRVARGSKKLLRPLEKSSLPPKWKVEVLDYGKMSTTPNSARRKEEEDGGGGPDLGAWLSEGNRMTFLLAPLTLISTLAFLEACYSTSLLLSLARTSWVHKSLLAWISVSLSSIFYYLMPWEAFRQGGAVAGFTSADCGNVRSVVRPRRAFLGDVREAMVDAIAEKATGCYYGTCGSRSFFSNSGLMYLAIMNGVVLSVLSVLAVVWPKKSHPVATDIPQRLVRSLEDSFYGTTTGKAAVVVIGIPVLAFLAHNLLRSGDSGACMETVAAGAKDLSARITDAAGAIGLMASDKEEEKDGGISVKKVGKQGILATVKKEEAAGTGKRSDTVTVEVKARVGESAGKKKKR